MDTNSIEPRILDAIDEAVAKNIPMQYVSYGLTVAGWPRELVNASINEWMRLNAHGRVGRHTDFSNWIRKYQSKAWRYNIILTAVNLIGTGLILLKPWPTKVMADSAFGSIRAPGFLADYTNTSTLILILSVFTLLIFLFGWMVGLLKDYALVVFGFKLNRSLKRESFNHILHLPLYHQSRLAKGDYVYRQNIVTNSLSDLVLGTTSSIIESSVLIFGVLIIMLLLNPYLTFISVILIPLIIVIMKLFTPYMAKYGRALNENASKTASLTTESVDNAESVQAFVLEDAQLERVDTLWYQHHLLTKRIVVWSKFFKGSNSLVIVIGTAIVMYFGGSMALEGEITFGELLVFMTYMGFLLSPVESLAAQFAVRGQKRVDLRRVFDVLSDHEGVEYLRKDRPLSLNGLPTIELNDIAYTYNKVPVLHNVNLTVRPGEKVAFIGPSGGGKSTLLKLLPLFIEPTSGQITLNGIDTQTVSLQGLREQIAWIGQSPQLFNKRLVDNLLDGDVKRSIPNEEIYDVLVASNVTEFIDKLPLGVETPSGEGGGGMSGGQRQRLAIARALLRQAPILCMDEPTAALDFKSENVIKDSLGRFIEGRTVLLVTHRRALLSLMDTIYVVDNGTVRDVNEYGGLETYLAALEGAEAQSTEVVKAVPDQISRTAVIQDEVEQVMADTERLLMPAQDTLQNDMTIEIKH